MPSYAHMSIIRSHSCHHRELSTVFPYAKFSPIIPSTQTIFLLHPKRSRSSANTIIVPQDQACLLPVAQ